MQEADIDGGVAQRLHDLFWRRLAAQEAAGSGSVEPAAGCAPGPADPA